MLLANIESHLILFFCISFYKFKMRLRLKNPKMGSQLSKLEEKDLFYLIFEVI